MSFYPLIFLLSPAYLLLSPTELPPCAGESNLKEKVRTSEWVHFGKAELPAKPEGRAKQLVEFLQGPPYERID